MPVLPQNLLKVALRGSLFTPTGNSEQFQHGFWLHLDDPGDLGSIDWGLSTQWTAEQIIDKWETAFAGMASAFGNTVSYDECRVYHLDADTGLTLDRGQAFVSGFTAGSGTTCLPHECALCVSLYSYVPGAMSGTAAARRRGRMYLPALSGSSVDEYGLVTDARRATILGQVDSFFEDVQGMHALPDPTINIHWDLVTVSRRDVAYHQVERIGLGQVIDVQRRRRRNELERPAYTVLSHE